jgi:hypothetical protein
MCVGAGGGDASSAARTGHDQARLIAGKVRDHHRMPVIALACWAKPAR